MDYNVDFGGTKAPPYGIKRSFSVKKSVLYIVWGILYCACVGCSFIPDPGPVGKGLLVGLSLLFFAPPFYLLFRARKEESRKTLLALRLVSVGILVLSLILLVLNFLSVYFSAHTGLVLYVLLVMFTPPMVCAQSWFLSLFLWAVLMMLSFQKKCPCQK